MTCSFELNYVIWESYKPKTVSAPFLSIFVSSVLWFWPWHFSNFTQKWNSMVQIDLDEIFTMTLVSSLNYVIWNSKNCFRSIFVHFYLIGFVILSWHFSNFTQKWNSMVQVDRSRWDLYNDASFELKLCYLRKL